MIFPDVNLLVYAYDETSDFHESAASWLEEVLTTGQVFFSWQTISGFLRIVTNRRIFHNPLDITRAIEIVESWLDLDNTYIVSLEKKNWPLFKDMLINGQSDGNLVMDAHLAAMAASSGATLASTDRDFARFPAVQLLNPLKS